MDYGWETVCTAFDSANLRTTSSKLNNSGFDGQAESFFTHYPHPLFAIDVKHQILLPTDI